MSTPNNETFVRVTNKDIYNKLTDIEKHIIKINGKVKLNKWLASTALAVALLVAGLKLNGVI